MYIPTVKINILKKSNISIFPDEFQCNFTDSSKQYSYIFKKIDGAINKPSIYANIHTLENDDPRSNVIKVNQDVKIVRLNQHQKINFFSFILNSNFI